MKKIVLFALQFIFCLAYCAEIEYRMIERTTQLQTKYAMSFAEEKVLKYMLIREFCEKKLNISRQDFLLIGSKFCNLLIDKKKKMPRQPSIFEKILSGNKVSHCVDTTVGCAIVAPIVEVVSWIATGCNMSNATLWGLAGGYAGVLAVPCVICGAYTCVEICCCSDKQIIQR